MNSDHKKPTDISPLRALLLLRMNDAEVCRLSHIYFNTTFPLLRTLTSSARQVSLTGVPVLRLLCVDIESEPCKRLRTHTDAAMGLDPIECPRRVGMVRHLC
jgi:hypothetical protein